MTLLQCSGILRIFFFVATCPVQGQALEAEHLSQPTHPAMTRITMSLFVATLVITIVGALFSGELFCLLYGGGGLLLCTIKLLLEETEKGEPAGVEKLIWGHVHTLVLLGTSVMFIWSRDLPSAQLTASYANILMMPTEFLGVIAAILAMVLRMLPQNIRV